MKMHNQPKPPPRPRRPRWEKRMHQRLVINSLDEGPRCILIPVHLRTTDTMQEVNSEAMVDCGATGDFIDEEFVQRTELPTRRLSSPIPVFNVDGTPNEAGSIDKVVDVLMTYNGHSERILLAVTRLGKQSMILGMTWLKKHNPEIDFITKKVEMTRCSPRCCAGCRLEQKEKRRAQRQEARDVNACRTGPRPAFVEDADDEDDETAGRPAEPSAEAPDEPL